MQNHNMKPTKILLGKPCYTTTGMESDTVDLGAPELVVRMDGTLTEIPNDAYKQLVEKGMP